MSVLVPDKAKVSPFLVFFILHGMQFGVGVLGFQRIIAKHAGYDAWIAALIGGLAIHPLIWMVYKMAGIAGGDIVSIHEYTFGKFLGKLISLPLIVYYASFSIITLRTFIQIVQVWMFPGLNTFWYGLAFLALVIYVIQGGFRTIVGVVFFGVLLTFYLLFVFLYTIPYSDYTDLLPVMDHSFKEIGRAAFHMSLSYAGWDLLLVYYPFIQQPQSSQKWAQGGALFTMVQYVFITVISFGYFSEGQLERTIWATLSMFKIVEMPFVERFEYIGIVTWTLNVLPIVCLGLWAASRILKRTYNVKQKYSVYVLAVLILASLTLLQTREQENLLSDIMGIVGFSFNFGYLPLLFISVLIARKVKGNEKT
ncbi:spore gernimation protein GerB [Neobacillus notoginsengisoli]|uniref:Spore gernimation protein GerB n=1 Tax=Neobacillus notoginsengisoli TaxID=1578198 RepID=A0A417YSU3_9BACI|nr:GerAB/ArcD/ProY family transporter [Neobacillus notoginsengisoli]RHW39016.1 spore gernimation protein GerB [Neobacillus notoginsengisoli]